MEYATRSNELSRFTPLQVNTEERRMDHFEQGLTGDIRPLLVGQAFDNFQDLYQRAVKVARVLEESRRERQALALGKRKMELDRKGFSGDKRFRPDSYQGKEKGPMVEQRHPQCRNYGRYHEGPCNFEVICFECGEPGHVKKFCPKIPKSNLKKQPPVNQPRLPAPATRGRPPAARTNQPAWDARKPQSGGHVFCFEAEEEDEDPQAVVSGMFPINTFPTKVLFNAGATHSFINPATAKHIHYKKNDFRRRFFLIWAAK